MVRFVRLLVACVPHSDGTCFLCVLVLQELQDGQLLLRAAALTVLCVRKSVSVCQTVGPRRFGPDCKTPGPLRWEGAWACSFSVCL
jgi:hypothetical protein